MVAQQVLDKVVYVFMKFITKGELKDMVSW